MSVVNCPKPCNKYVVPERRPKYSEVDVAGLVEYAKRVEAERNAFTTLGSRQASP